MTTPLQKICEETIALRENSTPGKWRQVTEGMEYIRSFDKRTDYAVCHCWGGEGPRPKDARFIAHTANHAAQMARACLLMREALESIAAFHVEDISKFPILTIEDTTLARETITEVGALFSEER